MRAAFARMAWVISAGALIACQGSASAQADNAMVDPARAIELFQAARDRIDSWSHEPALEAARIPAAAFVIRFDGQIIGRGTAVGPQSLERALDDAMREAEQRAPIPRDALRDQNLRELASEVTVSMELAGPLVPFRPDTLLDVSLEVAPGRQGLAIRLADTVRAMFPSVMLSTQTEAASAAGALLAELSGRPALDMRSPEKLRDELGVVFYRFDTTHLTEPSPGEPPRFLHRGGRIVQAGEISGRSLLDLSDRVALFTLNRIIDDEDGPGAWLVGTIHPTRPGQTQSRADPVETAATALALIEYSRTPGVAHRAQALDGAAALLARFPREPSHVDPPGSPSDGPGSPGAGAGAATEDLAAAALAWSASLELIEAGAGTVPEPVVATARWARGVVERAAEDPGSIPEPVRGMVAHALATRWALTEPADRGDPRALDELLGSMLGSGDPERLVGQMPWLEWALIQRSRGLDSVRGAVVLRRIRQLIWGHQLTERDTGPADQDLVGGIVFTRSRMPLPTWQTLRVIAPLASAIGDPRLTPEPEVNAEVGRLVLALRFLRQLTADEWTAQMYPSPERAVGGVRAALWDQRMHPDAGAMALLTLSESLQSLDAIGRRRRADPQSAPSDQPRE